MRLISSVGLAVSLGWATGTTVLATPVQHDISAGLLAVSNVFDFDTNLASVTVLSPVNGLECASANRGDYTVRAAEGAAASYDTARGILIACVAENGRNNYATNVNYGTNAYPISSIELNEAGSYRIVTFMGGSTEYNVNVACAYFPYETFLAGYAYNSGGVNGGPNDSLTGSPGLVLGTHFKTTANGQFVVDLRSLGIDARTDGVLIVNHAKEEDNFALSQVNAADGTWNLYIRDNWESNIANYEQDPVAFAFIPKTNTMVVSGRFLANGAADAFSGSTPQFTVTPLATGRWRLAINGGSPTNGVLVISPEGGRSVNADNIVNYQPTAANDAWEIESRDTPGNSLQTPTGEPICSFVYVPAATPGFTLGSTNSLVTSGLGTTANFTVALHSKPATNVTIPLSSSDPGKGIPANASVTFTPGTWQMPRSVTVLGQSDSTTTNATFSIVLGAAVGADPGYTGLNPADVTVSFVPPRAAVVAPTNGNQTTGISPLLRVAVTNASQGQLTVQVYGRESQTNSPGPDFSMAVLPDTQMYTGELNGGKKEMIIAQTEWTITNRVARNIAYVTQLGDLVNNGDYFATTGVPNTNQWWNATNAMYRLENPVRTGLSNGMAYGIAVGNHEFSPIGNPTNGTTMYYNQYFGVNRFLGRSYYAGHWGTNNNNHYDVFSASGLDFVVIYFEYNPTPQADLLAWANDIVRTNANKRVIVVTHNMGNTQTPVAVSDQWTAIYNTLKTNSNVFLFLGGHVTGQGSRVDTHNGNDIYTFVQDYQGWENGGDGFMRLYEFSPSNNIVVVQTFSPYTGEWLTDEDSEFYFPYNMSAGSAPAIPWTTLGTSNSVAPGSVVGVVWPGLQANRKYEWYVRITDSVGATTISPVWEFTTTTNNSAPIVVNKLLTIQGDSSTNVTLTATDANSDPLTFQIPTGPTRGLIQNFDPASGTFSYTPARGYRGSDALSFRANDGITTSSSATLNLMVVGPPDSDGDGLPDSWESAYGISDPNSDSDGDGQDNAAEFAANTNPTNAASVLRITSAQPLTNGFFGLTWDSIGGTRYRVQFSNGQGVNAPFEDIPRNVASEMDSNSVGAAGSQVFVDDLSLTGPATNNARYYRVRVTQ